ncbi:MAG: 4,5-dihydroxyphthalate decarboxylase, partial [Actinoallomurus sp.]|nr:4,5-dihydroxyphthalate decarboxylase [Actinoallomurus sp.]
MSRVPITLACWDYDRTRALSDGTVRPEGIDLTYLSLPVEETFFRMLRHREFEAAEMSLSSHVTGLASRSTSSPRWSGSAGSGHLLAGVSPYSGRGAFGREVGLRVRCWCCHRSFPAGPLPHPACDFHRTGRSTCLSRWSA